jgi:hypothetical protein
MLFLIVYSGSVGFSVNRKRCGLAFHPVCGVFQRNCRSRWMRRMSGYCRKFSSQIEFTLTEAVRPLAVEELGEILAIDFDMGGGIPKLNRDFRWVDQEQAVLSACSSLIAIVKHWDSRRVQFSHFSVKEFLSSDRLATSEMTALRLFSPYPPRVGACYYGASSLRCFTPIR